MKFTLPVCRQKLLSTTTSDHKEFKHGFLRCDVYQTGFEVVNFLILNRKKKLCMVFVNENKWLIPDTDKLTPDKG